MAHLYHVAPGTRLLSGATVQLEAEEAHHASRVARLTVGERVLLGDGQGTLAQAEAVSVEKNLVELVVISVELHPRPAPELWLVQSLAKSGRDEQAIEAATEVGVTGVIPLQAGRSVVKWEGAKKATGQARWQRIVGEASKQSLSAHTPEVRQLRGVSDICEEASQWQLIVLDQRGVPLVEAELDTTEGAAPIALLVGPEGGFRDDEKDALVQAGGTLARLGHSVLRASTAGPVALALLHQRLGHWR